jgi:hypothetical protein
MTIERALEKHRGRLLRLSNVVGTGIGEQDREQVILIFGRHQAPSTKFAARNVSKAKLPVNGRF